MIQRTKTPRCKWCKNSFTRTRPGDVCCSVECGIQYGMKAAAKVRKAAELEQKKQTRAQREEMKTLPVLRVEAQREFNRFIRLRDAGKPCICCGKLPQSDPLTGGQWDCGHYRSVGSAPHLRFDERNAAGQLKQCNRDGAGRAVDYRIGLIARIGLAAVEALEADNTPLHYTKDDLRALKAHYKAKTRELLAGRG